MVTKIGINGFGRIGRTCMRASLQNPEVEVVAINGTSDPATLAHLLKYDSVHGTLPANVLNTDSEIILNNRPIKVFSERDPHKLPWGKLGVDIVIEATGKFNSRQGTLPHLENGAKKVIITAPAKDADATIVMGVNEHTYNPQTHHIISNASCTTNCLAPVVKVLHESFGILTGLMTTVHAFTTDQRSLDNSHKDLRRARSCVQSIVPTSTGAAKAIGLVIPELKGKFNGIAVRVPVPNVSLVDLVAEFRTEVTAEEINRTLLEASLGTMRGIIAYSEEPLVSIDYLGNNHSAVIDALSTMVVGTRTAKVIAWYDNEWGYSCRVIDLVHFVGQKLMPKENICTEQRIAG